MYFYWPTLLQRTDIHCSCFLSGPTPTIPSPQKEWTFWNINEIISIPCSKLPSGSLAPFKSEVHPMVCEPLLPASGRRTPRLSSCTWPFLLAFEQIKCVSTSGPWPPTASSSWPRYFQDTLLPLSGFCSNAFLEHRIKPAWPSFSFHPNLTSLFSLLHIPHHYLPLYHMMYFDFFVHLFVFYPSPIEHKPQVDRDLCLWTLARYSVNTCWMIE